VIGPRPALLAVLVSCAFFGCNQGQENVIGPSEPFRVRNAQFIAGLLPGEAPSAEPPDETKPYVTAVELSNQVVIQGQGNKSISGRANEFTSSVGLALEGVGTGYWILPTRSQDPITQELTWSGVADFDLGIEPGLHPLLSVGLDSDGNPGRQRGTKLCVASAIPDNFNSCDPKLAPPVATIGLSWDTNADLDLEVHTPDGLIVTPKHPSTVPLGDAGTGAAPAAGLIDRDSNASCVIDGVRRENLSWQTESPAGLYGIYANLFDGCKQPAVRFTVSIYTAVPNEAGGMSQYLWFQKSGELLDSQVNPGLGGGLFVTEFEFQ
jgi:hypothetical protein